MSKRWCEGERRSFPESDFRTFEDVAVHTSDRWHLTNGMAIEMASADTPVLEDGRPVVWLGDFEADLAPDDGPFVELDVAAAPPEEQ